MNRRLVFTAYDRPHYFHGSIGSWFYARGWADWQPAVHLEPSPVREYMSEIAESAGARVHHNPQRLGVLHNPWTALDAAFNTDADFAVLAEDDILVSNDILDYFTWAADTLHGRHILAVCAFNPAKTVQPGDEHTITTTRQFSPLIWGTWKDRWCSVLRDTWDHDYSSGTPAQPQSGWDWNINLRVMGDWRNAVPLASRSDHIGRHGGTHTTVFTFGSSRAATFTLNRPPGTFKMLDPTTD